MNVHAMPIAANALAMIEAAAARDPQKTAIYFEDREISFGALMAQSHRIATALRAQGALPGSAVAIYAENCPEYFAAYFAVLRCGATLFPINHELTQDEIAYILEKSGPVLLITSASLAERAEAARGQLSKPLAVLVLDALSQAEAEPEVPAQPRNLNTPAVVIHTSGTTARPKGVVTTDGMLITSARALHAVWDIRPSDISVCTLPLSYTFGLFSASFVALSAGASVLLFKKFNPVRVLEGIEIHRATYMVGVPTMYAMMMEHLRQTGKTYDVASVRMMAASGAPITLQAKLDFEALLRVKLRDYYALSECTPIFSFDLQSGQDVPRGAVGQLVPGAVIRLVDDHGAPVAPGAPGNLWVRSERLTPGYYLDPERSADAFDGAWFNTRDLARIDEQGFAFILGRDRDQVISGGHKIAATEIEDVIAQLPEVEQVAVVGAPDPILGEKVKAVIVCKAEHSLSPETVIAHCAFHLAAYKIPKIVELRTSLPVSPAGKILKRELI